MRTLFFNNSPKIIATSSVGGPKESEGQIGEYIDIKLKEDTFGEKTFERAESKMLFTAIKSVMENSGKKEHDIDLILSGDLLNQITASTFAARRFDIGYMGLYNACATFSESLLLAASLIDSNRLNNIITGTSSHFASAERQYRYPLELGCTRPPLSQWTVTGAGTCLISKEGEGPFISSATFGKIVDFGVTDANNMGAAMAPVACDTIAAHLKGTSTVASDYDLIVTGDLGTLGSRIVKDLLWEKGIDVSKQHVDCGELVYNLNESEYQGGSGAGCSSLVFCSYLYRLLKEKKIKKLLLITTGALLSSVSSLQGESIPGIAHAVCINA